MSIFKLRFPHDHGWPTATIEVYQSAPRPADPPDCGKPFPQPADPGGVQVIVMFDKPLTPAQSDRVQEMGLRHDWRGNHQRYLSHRIPARTEETGCP